MEYADRFKTVIGKKTFITDTIKTAIKYAK